MTELPDIYEIAGETFAADTQIGFAVRKGDADTKRAIEEALAIAATDGTYKKLIEKYGLPASVSLF